MANESQHWDQSDCLALDAILDELIPPSPQTAKPGAGELGVARFLFSVASKNSDFAASLESIRGFVASLTEAGAAPSGVTTEIVRRIESSLPLDFNRLLTETYKGYYSRADIRGTLGVGEHPVHPTGYRVEPESAGYLQQLTAPVRARGACYRDPQDTQKAQPPEQA